MMKLSYMILFTMGFYIFQLGAENLSYRHSATSVLNFVKKEYNINELSVISFDRDDKSVKRMIYSGQDRSDNCLSVM